MKKSVCLMIVVSFCLTVIFSIVARGADDAAQFAYPYLNYTLPLETRVADLLSRLTPEEKTQFLSSGAGAIPRLGIKAYNYGSEALHGITGPGNFTVFPQAIAMSGTWDPDLITQVTTAISDEAWGAINRDAPFWGYPGERFLTFWSPTINMVRDPRWGRTPETYGEDPFLTSRMAVAFVKGLQGNDPKYIKVVSTPKHFAVNNEEHNRHRCNAKVSERALREYYFPGYKAAVQEGGALSVMGAYNAINGIPCNANHWLLTEVLRDEWGFQGYVVTDCGSPTDIISQHKYAKNGEESASFTINAGVDVECGDDVIKKNILSAMDKGLVSEAALDQAVSRLLRVRFRLGMFDPPQMNPYTKISPNVIGSQKHVDLARKVSRESMVLLKNSEVDGRPMLPLNPDNLKTVAVVGPNAGRLQFGDYTGTPANTPVNPLEGIKNRIGGNVKVEYVPWLEAPIDSKYSLVNGGLLQQAGGGKGKTGLRAAYFANADISGKPEVERIEEAVDLSDSTVPPAIKGKREYSVRWTGTLVPMQTGAHYVYLASAGDARLYLDGKLAYEKSAVKKKKQSVKKGDALDSYNMDLQGDRKKPATLMLEAGRIYDIRVEYSTNKGLSVARLEWAPPGNDEQARAAEMKTIKNADAVIAVVGLWRELEHENIDRYDIDMPNDETEYLKQVMALNPNTVVVLINGSPIAINWVKENVPALVEAWYPGEQGGNAIADVLFGDYNPGGRLPTTWYKSVDDLPPFDDYEVSKGRTYMYFDKEPLFPFGYGLSYTTFEYKNLTIDDKAPKASGFINVSLDVKNTGGREGDEVVQIYTHDVESSVKQPIKQMKAFRRIHLEKGETKTVSFRIAISDLNFWDEKTKKFTVEPGEFEIMAGASSADIRLEDKIKVVGD